MKHPTVTKPAAACGKEVSHAAFLDEHGAYLKADPGDGKDGEGMPMALRTVPLCREHAGKVKAATIEFAKEPKGLVCHFDTRGLDSRREQA